MIYRDVDLCAITLITTWDVVNSFCTRTLCYIYHGSRLLYLVHVGHVALNAIHTVAAYGESNFFVVVRWWNVAYEFDRFILHLGENGNAFNDGGSYSSP